MLFDTYAWIEFFKGTSDGNKVAQILESQKCYTCIVSLAEIVEWCLKNNLDGKIDWGMIDSFILTSALVNNLKILTGDKHFEDLPNLIML